MASRPGDGAADNSLVTAAATGAIRSLCGFEQAYLADAHAPQTVKTQVQKTST